MNDKVNYAVEKLQAAFRRLQEGAEKADCELEKDGVIQRFEFTFEQFWKTLKIVLEAEGVETGSPRDCLEKGFRYGYLETDEPYLKMLEDRNKTSHIYNRKKAETIFNNIKELHIEKIKTVVNRLT